MIYLSWAAMYEGADDAAYFNVLIPRVMEEITLQHGTRISTIPANPAVIIPRGAIGKVSKKACLARQAFHLIFFHADTGGRNLEAGLDARASDYCKAMYKECDWPARRCVVIAPRHETEAWILADPHAVTAALGYAGAPGSIGLPATAKAAEKLPDPKQTLMAAVRAVRKGSRSVDVQQIAAAISQRQSLHLLRYADSFADLETNLHHALADLGCVNPR